MSDCGGSAHDANNVAAIPQVIASASPVVASPAPDASKPVEVQLEFALPSPATQAMLKQTLGQRRAQYISTSNTQLTVAVTPLGGSTSTTTPSSCTPVSCAVSFTTNPGPTTLAFTLSDAGNNVLAQFSTLTIVQPQAINTLKFSANPVVNSVTLSLASPSTNAGTPTDLLLTVNAKDFDGNTIVGNDNYVDAGGRPISLNLSVANTQAGGRGTVSIIGPPRITKPGQAAIYARYNGQWLDHSDIAVTSTSPIAGTLSGTTLTTIPRVIEYTIAANPVGIVSAPDGNLWVAQYGGNQVAKIRVDGTVTQYACGSCNLPRNLAVGADGNLWVTAAGSNAIYKMSLNGSLLATYAVPSSPLRINAGPDGSLYFGTGIANTLSKITITGTVTNLSSGLPVRGIGFGPEGNIWYLSQSTTSIYKRDRFGTLLGTYNIATSNGSESEGVIIGPDGKMWFVNQAGDLIQTSTLNGTVTSYALPATAGPRDIVNGPDGNMWYVEGGRSAIGRITTAGVTTEYGASSGISATANPYALTLGPDGNIWFTEFNNGKVAKFIL